MSMPTDSIKQKKRCIRTLGLIKRHFPWVSSVAVGSASLLALSSLLIFTQFIGRPDVFIDSLEPGVDLVLLALFHLMILVIVVVGLLILSLVYTWLLDFLAPDQGYEKLIAGWVFCVLASGAASFILAIWVVVFLEEKDYRVGSWLSSVGLVIPALLSFWLVRRHGGHLKGLRLSVSAKKKILRNCRKGVYGMVASFWLFLRWVNSVGFFIFVGVELIFISVLMMLIHFYKDGYEIAHWLLLDCIVILSLPFMWQYCGYGVLVKKTGLSMVLKKLRSRECRRFSAEKVVLLRCRVSFPAFVVPVVLLVVWLPAWYIVGFHDGSFGMDGWSVWVAWWVLSLGALFPALAIYVGKNGEVFNIKKILIGMLVFCLVLLSVVPRVVAVPSVLSMKLLGVSDQEVRRYLVDGRKYPASSLPSRWPVVEYGDGLYSIKGFPLYAYGSIKLLCPPDLVGLGVGDIRQHTHVCIAFRENEVRKLGQIGGRDKLSL